MISFEFIGLGRLFARLEAERFPGAVAATIERETEILELTVKERMASLFRNPGKMLRSVDHTVTTSPGTAEGVVYAQGLPYLRIHEYGGTTRPHEILPRNAKVLAFPAPASFGFKGLAATEMVFTRKVVHPGSRIPERSFMRSALALRRAAIITALRLATIGSI